MSAAFSGISYGEEKSPCSCDRVKSFVSNAPSLPGECDTEFMGITESEFS